MTSEPQGPQLVTALGCQHLLPAQIGAVSAALSTDPGNVRIVKTRRPVELAFYSWAASMWYAHRIHGGPTQVAAIMHPGCTGVQAYHGHHIKPLTPRRENTLRELRIAGGFDQLFRLAVNSRFPDALVQPWLLRGTELQLIAA